MSSAPPPTAAISDACLQLGHSLRVAPAGLKPTQPDVRVAGKALPVRHRGSVDDFLEALGGAEPGSILVVDNGGRLDEACVGDLVAVEVEAAGLAAMVVWGLHRDETELARLSIPVFSYGTIPAGPDPDPARKTEPATPVMLGEVEVSSNDLVVADVDGVVLVASSIADDVFTAAHGIAERERAQFDAVVDGTSLRDQLRFEEYLAERAANPGFTFREHLKKVGGAIER
jgi:4-hydroxy-4-methyl-2-oxoglutarate aldolase